MERWLRVPPKADKLQRRRFLLIGFELLKSPLKKIERGIWKGG
jgi:hypothetical protein